MGHAQDWERRRGPFHSESRDDRHPRVFGHGFAFSLPRVRQLPLQWPCRTHPFEIAFR
jgi:hypothetical protein